MFEKTTKIQARVLLAAKKAGTFTKESLRQDIAEQFNKRYKKIEIWLEFQRFVECKFFEADIRGSVMYHQLSESGKRIARKLSAIAENPESEYHELTQPSMSPNIRQQLPA